MQIAEMSAFIVSPNTLLFVRCSLYCFLRYILYYIALFDLLIQKISSLITKISQFAIKKFSAEGGVPHPI